MCRKSTKNTADGIAKRLFFAILANFNLKMGVI